MADRRSGSRCSSCSTSALLVMVWLTTSSQAAQALQSSTDTQRIHKLGVIQQLWPQARQWQAAGGAAQQNSTSAVPAAGASSSSFSPMEDEDGAEESQQQAPAVDGSRSSRMGGGSMCDPKAEQELEALCTAAYTPVCGKDGRTYHSRCHLLGSCVSLAHSGECGSRSPTSLPNFDYHPKLGFIYLCAAVLAFVCLILDHLAVPR